MEAKYIENDKQILFSSLCGSYDYGLNIEDSDHDYCTIILPTKIDLINKKMLSLDTKIDENDHKIYDIRKYISLLMKNTNPIILEPLFSKDIKMNIHNVKTVEYIKELFDNKQLIAIKNLSLFFYISWNMYNSKICLVNKPTKSRSLLIDKHGYNTKDAMHTLRFLDMLERFAYTDFTDFGHAIQYGENEEFKKLLIDIRHGKISYDDYNKLLTDKEQHVKKDIQPLYYAFQSNTSNEKKYEYFESLAIEIIKNEWESLL